MNELISELVGYGIEKGLVEEDDKIYVINRLLELFRLDSYTQTDKAIRQLSEILSDMTDYAAEHGLIPENTNVYRDLFDTKIMGILTPAPSVVRAKFTDLYVKNPKKATDFYYQFSQDTNYIRKDRVARDKKWKADTQYGKIDITINLSKPEKDPRDIARAATQAKNDYPKCLLCAENEGYAGTLSHPARQNHRIIPLKLDGQDYYMQYSPYVYYNEHCICLNREHTPMKIDRACFGKLLDFVRQFPHYFVGSNADLPIVGGSILTHEHFQGGHYTFAMTKAPIETAYAFAGYKDIEAGIVKWPMSVLRLRGDEPARICDLADKVLQAWRGYTDPDAFIYAETDGTPHNTITPIARFRNGKYELDLVLRNNITTPACPDGLYHPHPEYHHIKKENIGLIEVMGLAVLPARLKTELELLRDALLHGTDIAADERIAKHKDWAMEIAAKNALTAENCMDILQQEVGKVFAAILEQCGVFDRNEAGKAQFLRFLSSIETA